jgi:FMN-dependent NADH-azoreductase
VRILRIDSSADTDGSQSRRLADRIIAGIRASGEPLEVTVRDLSMPLPQLTQAWIRANKTPAADRTPEQMAELALSETLIAEIENADTLVIGAPLYNFAIPASLKLWVDLVCRARRTFAYTDAGPKGLMQGKRAIVCFVSGGTPFGSGIDFASGYLRHILGFIGIEDVTFVTASQHFRDAGALEAAGVQADHAAKALVVAAGA